MNPTGHAPRSQDQPITVSDIESQIAAEGVSPANPVVVFGYSQSSTTASLIMQQLHAAGVPSDGWPQGVTDALDDRPNPVSHLIYRAGCSRPAARAISSSSYRFVLGCTDVGVGRGDSKQHPRSARTLLHVRKPGVDRSTESLLCASCVCQLAGPDRRELREVLFEQMPKGQRGNRSAPETGSGTAVVISCQPMRLVRLFAIVVAVVSRTSISRPPSSVANAVSAAIGIATASRRLPASKSSTKRLKS